MFLFSMTTQARMHKNNPRGKKMKLGWSVLLHPPYLPDLVPTHFYRFWIMGKGFDVKKKTTKKQTMFK